MCQTGNDQNTQNTSHYAEGSNNLITLKLDITNVLQMETMTIVRREIEEGYSSQSDEDGSKESSRDH